MDKSKRHLAWWVVGLLAVAAIVAWHGPERLNGFLSVSGFSQMAAYGCCGLLLGMTQLRGGGPKVIVCHR